MRSLASARWIFIVSLAVAVLVGHGIARAEPRVALVIGNSDYGAEIGSLANPANDAKLMAKTLRGIGFTVVEVENADQNAMKRAIVEFGNKLGDAGSEATGLFYYAGHGLQVQGENFLIPVKAQIERESDVDIEAVSADLVLKQMDFAGSAVNIVILDACRNNPLTRGFRSQVRGLAEITRKPRGSFVAYSTAPGDVAADGAGANSPYATALAETIVEPGQGIEEIFREVRTKVLAATDNKQTPWDSSSLTAPFYFEAAPATATAVAVPASVDSVDPKRIELAFWESIKDSKSTDDFQAYLAKYPKGDFASLAANRLKALGASSTAVAAAAPQSETTVRNLPPGKDDETAAAYEAAFWDSVKDSGRAEDIQAYLNKYPHGQFAEPAAQRLKALGAAAPATPAPSTTPVEPAIAFDPVDMQIFVRERARLRTAPAMNAEVIDRVPVNTALKATGRSPDGAWWRITIVGGRIAYIPGVAVSEQPIAPPATVSPAPAPATAPAAQAANAPPSTPDTPAAAKPSSGNDADVCKTESGSPAADRAAACRRVLNGQLDNDTRQTTLIDLGNALDALGQSEEAMRNYREAVELNPKDSTAYYNIGILHLNQRRYAEARTAFEKAASLAPDDPAPVYQRAVVLGDLGDANSALIAIKRAIAMKADDSSFYDELAVLQLAAGDVADASAAVDKAISIDNGYWSGTAVITYYLAGDREKAGAMIDRGYKEQPSYPYWPIWRALVQKSAGDEAGAQQTLAAGLRIVGTRWPAPLIKFMAGGLSESKLRGFANTGDQRTRSEQLCEVEFYRGELAYLAGDKATAKAAMRAATTARIYYYLEDAAAHARLAQLSQ